MLRGLLSSCRAQASRCRGFACCRAWAPGLLCSEAVEHGPSCFEAQDLPGPGVEPVSPATRMGKQIPSAGPLEKSWHTCSFLLVIFLGIELLDHIILCLLILRTVRLCSKLAVTFYIFIPPAIAFLIENYPCGFRINSLWSHWMILLMYC